jgi:hypothetical protein
MNLSMADLRNYCTEFHETWWSYRYMFLIWLTLSSILGGTNDFWRRSCIYVYTAVVLFCLWIISLARVRLDDRLNLAFLLYYIYAYTINWIGMIYNLWLLWGYAERWDWLSLRLYIELRWLSAALFCLSVLW